MANGCKLDCSGFGRFINKRFDEFADLHEDTIAQIQFHTAHKISTVIALRELTAWIEKRVHADPDFTLDYETILKWNKEAAK